MEKILYLAGRAPVALQKIGSRAGTRALDGGRA